MAAFDLPCSRYEESLSNAVRVNDAPRVFSANEAPLDVDVNLHHERAQTPFHPGKLFFFCDVAAESGGAISVRRADVLFDPLQQRRPELVRACRNKGLCSTPTMPAPVRRHAPHPGLLRGSGPSRLGGRSARVAARRRLGSFRRIRPGVDPSPSRNHDGPARPARRDGLRFRFL